MNLVYFGEDLNRRAPEIFGCLCTDPGTKWVSLLDVVAALQEGRPVSIRQASESELRRAEALVALRNVGEEIARRITQVLDQQEPAVVMGAITRTREALESADDGGPIQLLDL